MLLRSTLAIALAAALVGQAQAQGYSPYGPAREEILSELPANAPPGDCYARVKVPGEPAGPPPMMMGAQWVLNPGPPGSPGPIWCLVPTGPMPVAAQAPTIERYGWIRVLCDADATPTRIRQVQQRLHDRGYYRGELSGHYDATTAAAVGQFQAQVHIGHGGYLSMQTIEALDQGQSGYVSGYGSGYASGYGTGYAVQSYQQVGGYQQTGGYALPSPCVQVSTCAYAPPPPPPVYYQPPQPPCCYAPPVYQQPVYQPPVAYAPPCCAPPPPPCCAAYQGAGYVQGYYGSPTPAYAAASASASASAYAGGGRATARASASASASVVQNGWLTWGGQTRY